MIVENTQATQSPAQGSRHVLIIDDDIMFCREAVECFIAAGYSGNYATSGAEAVNLLNLNPAIQTVIVDIWMPDVNGIKLIKQLQALFNGSRQLKFFIASGAAGIEDAIDALRLGVEDFLLKPMSPLALVEAVAANQHATPG